MIDRLVEALTKRAECSHGVWAWACWCPTCSANIVSEYRSGDEHALPYSVRQTVAEAEARLAQPAPGAD